MPRLPLLTRIFGSFSKTSAGRRNPGQTGPSCPGAERHLGVGLSIFGDNVWRRGRDVVLAAVQILDCALVSTPSLAERRGARPEAQPFVAAGSSVAAATEWRFVTDGKNITGVEATIDTSSAGFQSTPAYSSQLVGTRVFKAATGTGVSNGQLVDGFGSVVQPLATSLVFRLMME